MKEGGRFSGEILNRPSGLNPKFENGGGGAGGGVEEEEEEEEEEEDGRKIILYKLNVTLLLLLLSAADFLSNYLMSNQGIIVTIPDSCTRCSHASENESQAAFPAIDLSVLP
jgi:hypothetical protein